MRRDRASTFPLPRRQLFHPQPRQEPGPSPRPGRRHRSQWPARLRHSGQGAPQLRITRGVPCSRRAPGVHPLLRRHRDRRRPGADHAAPLGPLQPEPSGHRPRALDLSSLQLLMFDPDTTLDSVRKNLVFFEYAAELPFNFGRVELYAGTPLLAAHAGWSGAVAATTCSGTTPSDRRSSSAFTSWRWLASSRAISARTRWPTPSRACASTWRSSGASTQAPMTRRSTSPDAS